MPCNRCGKQNPADVHTCTPCREYMLDIIQKEINPNQEFTILNTIVIEKSTGRRHIIRGFNIEGIVTLNLHTMRNMSLSWEGYYIPIMLGDVLDNIGLSDSEIILNIVYKRHEKRKPLSDQSDECISYIRSLLPPEVRK